MGAQGCKAGSYSRGATYFLQSFHDH